MLGTCASWLSERVQPARQVTARPIDWLWANRLALGKLAIVDGDPGLGKSLLALDLCARLSTGRPFPDGSPSPGPANALVINAEDGAADTIRPRLEALGADLDRVFILRTDADDDRGPLRLPTHANMLGGIVTQTQAKLVIFDPIMAFLDSFILCGNDKTVRDGLAPIARLAQQHHCTALMVRHLNKTNRRTAVYRGSGALGILGLCRSGWLIARAPEQNGHRVVAQVKNNLAGPQPSLAFAIESAAADRFPTVNWTGSCAWAADQLLTRMGLKAPFPTPLAHACDFLRAFIEDGPRTSREVWQAAQEQGLTKRTLHRAKRNLRIRSRRVWRANKQLSYWVLPGQALPEAEPIDAEIRELDAALEELNRKFPPATPLDDL